MLYVPRRNLLRTGASAAAGVALFNIGGRATFANGCRSGAASAAGTSITGTGQTISDGAGTTYSLTSGAQVAANGSVDTSTSRTIAMWWDGSRVFREDYTGQWFQKSGSSWVAAAQPSGPPKFWDDFSEGSVDWANKWWGYPQGSPGYIDQSDPGLQADCRSVDVVASGGNYFLRNSALLKPADAPSSLSSFTYCVAEIVSKFQYTLGYSVGRLKMPVDDGVMGAFWDFRIAGWTRDQYEELDNTENPGPANGTRPVVQTIHYGPNYPGMAQGFYNYWQPAQDSTHWHIYSWEWDAYPGNCTTYLDGAQQGQQATPASFGDPMNLWISTYVNSDGSAWFGPLSGNTTWPARSVYDWVGVFNNKAEADAWLAARPQYSTAVGAADGPSTSS